MLRSDSLIGKISSHGINGSFEKVFLEHPHACGEKYGEHLLFTIKVAGYLVATSICLVIHGLMPRFHQITTSQRISALNNLFRLRSRQH